MAPLRPRLTAVIVCVLFALGSGCVERKAHRDARKNQVLLTAAPSPTHPLDVRFGDKVELIGYDLDNPRPRPGQLFKVTWYWRVRAPLAPGFKLFTHLADATGRTIQNLDGERLLRAAHPEADWRAGEWIKDEQLVTLPEGWSSPVALFYLGFYKEAERLPVTRGRKDDQARAEALRLPVAAASAPALPALAVNRRKGAIAIDGKLDEADWGAAAVSDAMVNTISGGPGAFGARARVLYDDQRIYIGFEVEDDYLKSTFTRADEHLWVEDTTEVMFDPDGDGKNYFELQVSPRGVHFDTRYDARRDPRPFGHVDWDSQVEAEVDLRGTLDDSAADSGYSVELAIPFRAFEAGATPAAPPGPGTTWRVNFFVMDARASGQRAVGWSAPRVGDFHTLERFGRLEFR